MCEFQGTGGVVIIHWFLGVKVGETEFEKWRVGCVCKSFPLRFF